MADPLRSRARALAEHGDRADVVAVQITIKVFASGAMSVEGPIDEREWMLAALENAKDAVRNHRSKVPLVIPGKDVSVP